MAEIAELSPTAALNTGRFPEGQLVPSLNNGARELEAILARWFIDTNGSIATSGTAGDYAILTTRAITAYAAGQWFLVRFHTGNTGPSQFKVNALAAKDLKRPGGDDLVAGDIKTNQLGLVVYNAAEDHFELIGLSGSPAVAPTYTVATLPEEGVLGQMVFVRDGRKAGESEGNGTGVLCYWDGSAWVTCDAGAAVEA